MVDRHSGCPIPDGRELKSEIQKDGSKTLNYVNLGTGIRVNSVEDMFRYKDRESGENTPKQFSDWRPHQSRPSILQSVKEVGHNIFRCPLAQQAAIVKPTAAGQLAILHAV
ncbi:hypothetical protein PRUPE_2G159200 [Prunus persica]|uniref:Uncharacterized protein n=1 Tax=Prunus persica TaxID=3760 RepID=A0A251QHP1_PRUPE|nr:hypothetical protein PRUPE_2G159200 [Prunus persica]ONI22921.1 hypothetical protein PRUPE_2G159200 [Prunus persica]